jgi:hypothetical protein
MSLGLLLAESQHSTTPVSGQQFSQKAYRLLSDKSNPQDHISTCQGIAALAIYEVLFGSSKKAYELLKDSPLELMVTSTINNKCELLALLYSPDERAHHAYVRQAAIYIASRFHVLHA